MSCGVESVSSQGSCFPVPILYPTSCKNLPVPPKLLRKESSSPGPSADLDPFLSPGNSVSSAPSSCLLLWLSCSGFRRERASTFWTLLLLCRHLCVVLWKDSSQAWKGSLIVSDGWVRISGTWPRYTLPVIVNSVCKQFKRHWEAVSYYIRRSLSSLLLRSRHPAWAPTLALGATALCAWPPRPNTCKDIQWNLLPMTDFPTFSIGTITKSLISFCSAPGWCWKEKSLFLMLIRNKYRGRNYHLELEISFFSSIFQPTLMSESFATSPLTLSFCPLTPPTLILSLVLSVLHGSS